MDKKKGEGIDFNAYNLRPAGSYLDDIKTDFSDFLNIIEEADAAAKELADELRALFPKTREIHIDPLSLSVACHIGEGALAVACSKFVPELDA